MLVHTLSLPFGKINANRIYWEVGIAPVLCRQALAHVPAVFCRSSDSASPGDHHAWLDSKPGRYTDSSVILTPLWHYRERNTVQRGANQGRETGSSMRHLQTRADPCNVRIITGSWSKKAVLVHYSAHRSVPLPVSTQCPLRELLRSSRMSLQRCTQRCGKGCRIEQVLSPPLLQRPYRCRQIIREQQKCCRAFGPWATAVL
jgi:hypothetical protein